MKIKRLIIRDYRCFRGERVFDFTDKSTGDPLNRVLLVGSNGSGKTTLLDLMYVILGLVDRTALSNPILTEIPAAEMTVEVERHMVEKASRNALQSNANEKVEIGIGLGKESVLNLPFWLNASQKKIDVGVQVGPGTHIVPTQGYSNEGSALMKYVDSIRAGNTQMQGGLLYFPHNRQLLVSGGGPIQPPSKGKDTQWTYKYTTDSVWEGSLEQYWVWLNYLDLENRDKGKKTNKLADSLEVLKEILGPTRRVEIEEGRVYVETHWSEKEGQPPKRVTLDQLPSGEKQCVLLFGEVARRERKGSVLFIDEPEISLHPTLQRQFLSQIRRMSKVLDMQVFLATHSLEMVRNIPENEIISLDDSEDFILKRPPTTENE